MTEREIGGVGESLKDWRAAALADAAQDLCAGGVRGGEEVVAVEAPVPQHQHLGAQMVQQPGGVGGFALPGGAEDRRDDGPGAGLDQRHQLDLGIPAVRAPPQPAPVAFAVRHLDRAAAVERHRPIRAEPHPRHGWPSQRPGQHLEQRTHRRAAESAAQITECLRARADNRHPRQTGRQLGPHEPIADLGEHARRQQKVDPDP
jgi:hypothetical protein